MRAAAAAAALSILFASPPSAGQVYRFPTSIDDYTHFYPTSYYDQDGTGGWEDWNCGSNSYDGHRGSDYGVGGFTGMAEGRDIVSAAAGTVILTHDGEDDHCTTGDCGGGGGYGNYVRIQHADGRTTTYGHMVTWSVAVEVGEAVDCGTFLGLVGSSGNSTGPHIHFEVRNPASSAIDPFSGPCSGPTSLWTNQGAYDAKPTLDCDGSPPPACTFGDAAECGRTLAGDTAGGGSSNAVVYYACGTWDYSGPEYAYRFTALVTEPVTVEMTGLTDDLDIMILEGDGCDPSTCFATSDNPDTTDESVTFDAVAGTTYAIVLDGFEGVTSTYELVLSCTVLPDLSLEASIDPIDGQDPDFNASGTSAGIFDLHAGQQTPVRIAFQNGGVAPAAGLTAGLRAEQPWLRVARWEILTDDPAAGCGEPWCPDPAALLPGQPPADDPGSEFTLALGDLPAGVAKMVVLETAGIEPSSDAHPEVQAWVRHADSVYDKDGFDAEPTLNLGQGWNSGDLRIAARMDIWPGSPPGDGVEPVPEDLLPDETPPSMNGSEGCGCAIPGSGSSPIPALLVVAAVVLSTVRGRSSRSRGPS